MSDAAKNVKREQALAINLSIVGAIALFIIPAVVGIMVNSITLLLDASAALVMLVVAFLIRFSLKKIHQPADEIYNFGYAKYEPLTVVIQSILIIATCVVSMKFAIQDIVHPEDIVSYGLPVIGTFVSGTIALSIGFYLRMAGRHSRSRMLKTSSLHWFTDCILSFAMCAGFLIGLILKNLGYLKTAAYVDPIMAIILAIFLMWAPIGLLLHHVIELLDKVPDKETQNQIKEVVKEYKPKAFGLHRIRIRNAGEKVFVEICFLVKGDSTIKENDELAKNFESDIKKRLPSCDVVVFFKPAAA